MGIFNRLGKRFEKLKREAEAASSEEATHACVECETLLYTEYETCPECGSDRVGKLGGD